MSEPNECEDCGCEVGPFEDYCVDCEPDSCEDCGIDIPQGEDLCDACMDERDEAAEDYDLLDDEEEDE
jgi:hypothetical protein